MFLPVPNDFSKDIQKIGHHLVQTLQSPPDGACSTVAGAWKVFQSELALEMLLYGHVNCSKSRLYSISLGPFIQSSVLVPEPKDPHGLEFLALETATACQVDANDLPPLEIWIDNKIKVSKVRTHSMLGIIQGKY